MPYLEHTQHLQTLNVTESEEGPDGTFQDFECGRISANAHWAVYLDNDATQVTERTFDGITLVIHRDLAEPGDNDYRREVRLSPAEITTLRDLLSKVEVA